MTIAKKFTLLLWVFLLPVVHVFSQCTPTNLGSSQVISTNTTWSSGTYNINGDFTVNAGVTLTISYNPNNCPFIVNATNITILGTINADGAGGRGGAGGAGGGSSGGAGGGSLAAGGGAGGPGSGAGGGTPGSAGGTASGGCGIDCGNVVCAGGNDADRAGAGGAGGGAGGSFGGSGGSGDAGAAGRIENEPGNSNCGSAPVAGTAGGGNAAPVAYGNTAINNDLASGSGGAGGGGGGGGFSGGTAGSAGGNGGGSVNLNASADLVVSGIISASGTNGSVGGNGGDRSGAGNWNCETCSNADGGGGNDCRDASQCGVCTYYTWGWPGGGGGGSGGGSGGGIKVQAKGNMNLTGTLLANGGGGGGAGHPFQSDASCNHIAGAGGPGAGGVIKYVYNPCASNVFSPAAAQVHAGFTGTTGTGALDTNTGSNGTVLDETADIYIPGFSPVPAPVAANNQLLCGPGHAPAAISANGISGGTGSYTYQWYASTANANGQTGSNSTAAPGFNIITGATGTVLNSVFTGTLSQTTYYQMKVVSGPCTGWSNVVTVTVAPLPSISVAENDVLCNGGSTGSLTLTASSGTPAYTYSNDGGANYQSSNVFGSLTAGNYTLSVKDVNNCSATYASNPAVVAEPAALSMTDVPVNASCTNIANGSVTVTVVTGGVSPYQYSLNGGGNQSSNAFNNLPQADYLVQVTDNNGCTDTMTAIVSNSYSVSASLDATTDVSCFGGSNGMATVSMTGGVTPYLYSSDGSTFQTTPTLTGYSAGSFTATIKDDNGCIATVPVQIAQPTQLVVQIDSATTVPCNSSALGNIYSSTTGGVPGYTFLWNNNATDSNLTSLIAGTYTITATDNNSCTASATGAITVVSNFTTTASAIATTCFGSSDGSAFVVVNSGTGPFGYTWTSGATTDTVIGLAAGIVSVTVTDVNSCPSTATVTVNQPTAVTAQATAIQPTCAGANDGQAIASANGGTPTYSFAWSNSTSTDTASGLAPGSYSVTVLDANSCSATATASITDPTPISASLLVTGDSCSGQQNGSVQVSATGGTGLYTYAWSNSATGGYVNNLAAGTYTVTTSDSHNCSVTSSAVITSPDPLQIFTSSTGDLNGQGTGTATVDSVSGGTPPYFITGWSNGESVNPIVGLATGSYTVTVVDHHGCEQTATVTVSFISGITTTGKNDLSFDVYPNPAKTEINISLNDISREGVLNVSVKDVLGHTLLTKTLATPQTKVDISTLANGVYMVELKRGDKKVVKQIVVNK